MTRGMVNEKELQKDILLCYLFFFLSGVKLKDRMQICGNIMKDGGENGIKIVVK